MNVQKLDILKNKWTVIKIKNSNILVLEQIKKMYKITSIQDNNKT